MQLTNDDALRLVRQGAEALQAGRAAEARRHLETVTATGRANGQIWMLLASACRMGGDTAAEEGAVDGLLAIEPKSIRGNIMKADCRVARGDERGGLTFYEAAIALAAEAEVPDALRPELKRAEDVVSAWRARIDAEREVVLAARGFPAEGRSARFRESIDILAGRKRIYMQEPTGYYFPGLPQIQYYDTAGFDWVPGIEAATPAILEELNRLLAALHPRFRPYIHSDPNRPRIEGREMRDNPDWSVSFLAENGVRDEAAIAACPRTWAALQGTPLLDTANAPTAMFSLLRSGARIPAHTGMFNTRLICHLPLIVPPGCGFRVGNDVREWQVGKLIVFDDTIEHEAWNDSDEERVVLIFDIWRPELSAQERREVGALVQGTLIQ